MTEPANEDLEAELGRTERASDENEVAGFCAGARDGKSSGNFADNCDGDRNSWSARYIAADEAHAEFA